MELDVNGQVIEQPGPDAVRRAVAEAGADPEWGLTLSDDRGHVEASRQDDGSFRLARHDGKARYDAAEPVDAETLTALLLACLRGETSWRKDHDWVRAPLPAKSAAAAGEPPAWAIAAVVASVVLIVLASHLPREWVPFLDTTLGTVALFALPVVVMIGAMIANVGLKMRRAGSWLQAQGWITRSKLAVRRPPAGNEIGTAVNVPDVAYSFSVAGRGYQGKRVSFGDISGQFTEETVRRYPVGSVVTVHYDPADPTDCVLERGLSVSPPPTMAARAALPGRAASAPAAAPKADAAGCLIGLAVVAAFGAAGWWLAQGGVQELQARLPRAEVPVMLCAIGFGLLILLFLVAHRRRLARAAAWPVAPGRVTISRVETRRGSDDSGPTHRSYEAVVEFRYEVGDLSFSSRQIALGWRTSGARKGAEAVVARYPVGATVEVHYDPDNPSEAALERPRAASWLMLGAALACFAVALYASRIFR